jgi:hypothetical protein
VSRPRDWSPLRDSDPVGGDPQAIAELARRYADTAAAIDEASRSLRHIHNSATAWDSDAGRLFRDRTSDTAGTIERAFRRYEQTAVALSRYADELTDVQSRADALLRQAQQDDDEARAAGHARSQNAAATMPDPALDAQLAGREVNAAGRVAQARLSLGRLEEEWDAAGRRAASALEDITSADGLDDSWWDDVLDVVSIITDLAGYLCTWLGVIALVCACIPGLEEFAPVFAAASLITGAVALAGHALLYTDDRATTGQVLMDAAGLLTFGVGRALRVADEVVATGTRGAGSTLTPTARAPELPAAAEVSTAARVATASDRVGDCLVLHSATDSLTGEHPTSPVQENWPAEDAMVLAGAR